MYVDLVMGPVKSLLPGNVTDDPWFRRLPLSVM